MLAIVFATLAGAATIATFAVTIVMGQEYLPGRIGVASGVTIGLSIGLGGVGAPLLGPVADAHGLQSVFELIAVFPMVALALAPAAGGPARRATHEVPEEAGGPAVRWNAPAPAIASPGLTGQRRPADRGQPPERLIAQRCRAADRRCCSVLETSEDAAISGRAGRRPSYPDA